MKKLSIVIPLFNEEDCLEALWKRLHGVLADQATDFEVLFADDHSSDRTWEIIRSLHRREARVKGLRLARHSGHELAVFAGILRASGDAVLTLDGDLQHPPEMIPEFLQGWREGFELVYGFKTAQEGRSRLKQILNRAFHRMLALRIGTVLDRETSDFQLMNDRLVQKIKTSWRPKFFLRACIHRQARSCKAIPFKASRRYSGASKHKPHALMKMGLRALLFFPSSKPVLPSEPPAQELQIHFCELEDSLGFERSPKKILTESENSFI